MRNHFVKAMEEVYKYEGKEYTNKPADKGGPTKYGITLATLQNETPTATAKDVENLSLEAAFRIYMKRYWLVMQLDWVKSEKLCVAIMSMCVNFGTPRASLLLQKAINVCIPSPIALDGVLGPKTIETLNGIEERKLMLAFFDKCQERYIDICIKDASQLQFLKGWMERVNSFLSHL